MNQLHYPKPGKAMMAARRAAFDTPNRPQDFDHELFRSQEIFVASSDLHGERRSLLVNRIVDNLSTGPEGRGIGYCLLRGFSYFMSIEETRAASIVLLNAAWKRFRSRSPRISPSRDFRILESITHDGAIPTELFGSRWSFKPPHADCNSVLFAHVYGPTLGFDGGDVLLIDALAYAASRNLDFGDVCQWSSDAGDKKPVLRAAHVQPALDGYGRRLGRLGPDEMLFVNNGCDGVFHGASEVVVRDDNDFVRVLHRCVAMERGSEAS
ncbi:hypothetical protein [Amycolatopsis sp. NBC_00438]|uniref:hypothetical protein n=1 Tax=Amycolatopsis sp. NBC_00438 TaxID=2903558 RepID=UPI002E2148E3